MRRSKAVVIAGAFAVLVLVVGALAIAVPSITHAASILYVGGTVGTDSGCASPGYTSIQAAVDSAISGDTVYLCASGSPYSQEAVIGNKSLTLTGDAGVVMTPPASFTTTGLPSVFSSTPLATPETIVLVWGTGTVNVKGLTIEGPFSTGGSCAPQFFGMIAIAGGTMNATNDKVLKVENSDSSLYGCQDGVAILFGRMNWWDPSWNSVQENFVGKGSVTNTLVENYQKVGIQVDGSGSSATISDSIVTTSPPQNGANGIEVARGAAATIEDNWIADNDYAPCDGIPNGCGGNYATGIILYSGGGQPTTSGIVVKNNLFTGDQSSMDIYYDTGSAVSNAIEASGNCITQSGEYGAENDTDPAALAGFNAEGNWWGAAPGPTDSGNPGGTGNAILGTVDYAHWLTSAAPICQGPVISGLGVSLDKANLNISATASDAKTTAFSTITSAQYSLDGGAYTAMSATDGTFDTVTEAINATHTGYAIGAHKVCVKATDAAGITGGISCLSFTVTSTGLSGNGSTNAPQTAQGPSQPATQQNTGQASNTGNSQSHAQTSATSVSQSSPVSLALLAGLIVVFFGIVAGGALVLTRRRTQA